MRIYFKNRWRDIKKRDFIRFSIEDYGKNNHFILFDDYGNETSEKYLHNLNIIFYGNNNTVKLYKNLKLENYTTIVCSGENIFSIGKTPYTIDIVIAYRMSPYSKLIIGDNFSCINANFRLHREPNQTIIIGDDCMFSEFIYVKPSDGHTIYDVNTQQVINSPEDIIIGNHVWIGRQTTILKGSKIPNNSIVGNGAIYTNKTFKGNIEDGNKIFAGIPAKCIRENVNWDRKHTEEFIEHQK